MSTWSVLSCFEQFQKSVRTFFKLCSLRAHPILIYLFYTLFFSAEQDVYQELHLQDNKRSVFILVGLLNQFSIFVFGVCLSNLDRSEVVWLDPKSLIVIAT